MPFATQGVLPAALKSFALFKLLAGFYFLSLLVQVLYYSRIRDPTSSSDASSSFLRPSPDAERQTISSNIVRTRIRRDATATASDLIYNGGVSSTSDLVVVAVEDSESSESSITSQQRHRSNNDNRDLSFGLERFKTDDWHHLENYQPPEDLDPTLNVRLVNIGAPSGSIDDANTSVQRRRQMESRKPTVMFIHIRNSGGNSLCYAARANGMSTPPHGCELSEQPKVSSLLSSPRYDFVTSRHYVADVDTKKDMYRHVVMLRDSRDRYLSHWKSVVFRHPDQTSFTSWWQRQPDNWNVRVLCGAACAEVPKFQITRQQHELALWRLESFDDVLLLEHFNATFASLAAQVGWTLMPTPASTSSMVLLSSSTSDTSSAAQLRMAALQQRSESNGNSITQPSRWGWDPFMSALDADLYAHARQVLSRRGILPPDSAQKSAEDERAVQDYFDKGSARRCLNPCCHRECSPVE
jgi:hypothetical protein